MHWIVGMALGILIGFTLGSIYWANLCKKNGLFNSYGTLGRYDKETGYLEWGVQ